MMPGRVPTVLLLLAFVAACSPAPGGERADAGTGEAAAAAIPDRCAGLADPVQRLVCADVDLRAMDADLNRLYQRALARANHTAKAALRNEHAAWQRGLADCLDLPEARRRGCLDERYNAQLKALATRL